MLLLLADLETFLPENKTGLRLYVLETSPASKTSILLSFPPNFIVYLVHVSAVLHFTAMPPSQLSSQHGLRWTLGPPISLYVLSLYYWKASLLDQGSRRKKNDGKEI